MFGTSEDNLVERDDLKADGSNDSSGSFSVTIGSLNANQTYYYKAYIREWNAQTHNYDFRYDTGGIKSFTTHAGSDYVPTGWLELPEATSGSDYYTGTFTVGSARNYSYLYQYSTYTSLWTAYPLYSGTMGSGSGGSWIANPNISTSQQVNCWSASYNVKFGDINYVESIPAGSDYYARGHQIPNADRNTNSNSNWQAQTYIATNSTPQIQNKFNASIWSTLEGDIRTIARATDTVYVVTGAAFHKGSETPPITYIHPKGDPNKSVPVPLYYWKVLLKVSWTTNGNSKTISDAIAIGIWIPHQQYSSNNYSSYVKSVHQIEEWTGFDFFVNLPDHLPDHPEYDPEANTSWSDFQSF